MLNKNIKTLRQAKGLSQEELAIKLNVVRQTISKWEKGLSVPDAEMLIKLSDALDTTVSALLGEPNGPTNFSDTQTLSAKLELLNEQYSKQNDHRRKIYRVIFIIIGLYAASILLRYLYFFSVFYFPMASQAYVDSTITPNYFLLLHFFLPFLITLLIVIAAVFGVYYTRKR